MKCEYCSKEYNNGYSNRFCSLSCSKKYSSSFINYSNKKRGRCISCGKLIWISYNASFNNCKCEECKSKRRQKPHDFIFYHRLHIKTLIKYFGFDKSKMNNEEGPKEFQRIKEMLEDLYWNKHFTSSMICKKFGYPNVGNLTAKVFKYLCIKVKTIEESTRENILIGNHKLPVNPHYKYGWHTTWMNSKVFLRSSNEFNYANLLDENKIKYEVETKRIEYFDTQLQKYRVAIPDFYLIDSNTLVEIKSNYTLDKQNMIDKFKSYKENGYSTKLILDFKEVNLYEI